MKSPVGIKEAAIAIGVSVRFSPQVGAQREDYLPERTIGGHRRYTVAKLREEIAALKRRGRAKSG